jgi:hypothetical protein
MSVSSLTGNEVPYAVETEPGLFSFTPHHR